MPWQAIVEAIDNHDFSWNASETTQKAFTSGTGLAWNHLDGEPSASIECSRCKRINKTELTTTVDQQFWTTPGKVGEGGTGYADTGFGTSCSCGLTINHEVLRAQRFRKDLQKLLVHQVPMPGTLLSLDGLTPPAVSRRVQLDNPKNSTFRMSFPIAY